MYTYVYQVTVRPLENETEPGAFAGVNFGETGYAELINTPDYNEIYAIYTDLRIDRQLDLAPGVISYELVEKN